VPGKNNNNNKTHTHNNGKQHIDGRPAEGEKLLGAPAAVQSLAAMVQATGVKPVLNWENVSSRT